MRAPSNTTRRRCGGARVEERVHLVELGLGESGCRVGLDEQGRGAGQMPAPCPLLLVGGHVVVDPDQRPVVGSAAEDCRPLVLADTVPDPGPEAAGRQVVRVEVEVVPVGADPGNRAEHGRRVSLPHGRPAQLGASLQIGEPTGVARVEDDAVPAGPGDPLVAAEPVRVEHVQHPVDVDQDERGVVGGVSGHGVMSPWVGFLLSHGDGSRNANLTGAQFRARVRDEPGRRRTWSPV